MEGSPGEPVALLPPPPTARVSIACHGEDVTLRLHSQGIMATHPDLLWQGPAVFGLCLLLAIALLSGGPGAAAFFFIILLPALTLPASWFLLSLHHAIQQGVIDIVDDRLVISRYGVFGLEQDEWPIERLKAFQVVPVPSLGWTLLGQPSTMELELETQRGMQYCFFAGRDELELQWLADTLGQLTGIQLTIATDAA